MKSCKKVSLLTSITCGFLAGIMGFTGPQEIKAASRGMYLSDAIVITEKDIQKAKNDGYTVMTTPLGDQSLREEALDTELTKTYLAYKTTNSEKDAIREFKFMNMNGGFDFAKYDDYLEDIEAETKRSVGSLYTAIQGYRKYYNLGTKQGLFAHDALNIFRYDENDGLQSETVGNLTKENAINMKLGDLLLDTNLVNSGDCDILTDIFMEGNSLAIDSIYSMLNIANTKDDNGRNILEVLDEIKNVYYMFVDRTDLNDTLAMFEPDFARIRGDVNFYNEDSTRKYESFEDSFEALQYSFKLAEDDITNHTNYSDMWCNATKEIPFLRSIDYKGTSGNYENLLDLIMDEDADPVEYYPLLACMTEGVRATAFLGIIDTLTNTLLDENDYAQRITSLKNSDGYSEEILGHEGISVFYGVDRTLYQKGYVAMTTSAQEGAAKGDAAWTQISDTRYKIDQKTEDLLKALTIGVGGIVAVEGIGWIVARGLYASATQSLLKEQAIITQALTKPVGPYQAMEFGTEVIYSRVLSETGKKLSIPFAVEIEEVNANFPFTVEKNAAAYVSRGQAASSRTFYGALSRLISIGVIIAFVALIITLVFYIINLLKEDKEVYNKYTEIPGILCHRQPVYELSESGIRLNIKEQEEYVYYYGATNPYTVVTEAKYGNDDDGTKILGENKRNVQDIFNWELGPGKSREWLCLYYTKDARANYPITTNSLKLLSEVSADVSGATYFNNPKIEYNINTILTSNFYEQKANKANEVGTKYLSYNVNKRARENLSTGSIVANPSFWIFIVMGLAVGFGGGFLAFRLIDKKKKKANA